MDLEQEGGRACLFMKISSALVLTSNRTNRIKGGFGFQSKPIIKGKVACILYNAYKFTFSIL
jgi:hypothetical protein